MFSLKSLQLFLSFLSKKETFVVFKDVRDFATSFRGRESKLLISRILSNGRERFRLTEILGAVSSHLFKNKKSNFFFLREDLNFKTQNRKVFKLFSYLLYFCCCKRDFCTSSLLKTISLLHD